MKDRITREHLDRLCGLINTETRSPVEGWTTGADGRNHANPGHYEISGAYGGYNLHRVCSEGGGVNSVFTCGHVPARDLYNRMSAYLEGLRFK